MNKNIKISILTLILVFSLFLVNGSVINAADVDQNNTFSITEAREMQITLEFEEGTNPEDIQWYFGKADKSLKDFSQWKTWEGETGDHTGDPYITFVKEPKIEGDTLKATVKYDLPYGTDNLSPRSIRVLYPELMGEYVFTAWDQKNGLIRQQEVKVTPYESFRTWDEVTDDINQIVDYTSKNKEDRYIEYKSLGKTVEGRDIPMVVIAKDKSSVDRYLNSTLPMMLEKPGKLQEKINNGEYEDYKLPIWMHNIHPDEASALDGVVELLDIIATKDKYEYKDPVKGKEDVVEKSLNIDKALEEFIFIFTPTRNPDGRAHNSRTNANGLDLNRDSTYQTQIESKLVTEELADWTPLVFLDFHGHISPALIEPCTPPHDQNYEYDLLIDSMLENAHNMGDIAIANTEYNSYQIPSEDWSSGWDDASSGYAAVQALHHGALGHTLEIPHINEESVDMSIYLGIGSIDYALKNKTELFKNQLEYFYRGVNNIDAADKVDQYFVDSEGNSIGRRRGNNENFFPEYYVIPVDDKLQKNSLAAYNMVEYLLRNGIKVEVSQEKAKINGVTYPEGSYIVPMHQAKRGLANTVLYEGMDLSGWDAMYAEVVQNFPALRGFDSKAIRKENVFKDKTKEISATEFSIPDTKMPDGKQIIIHSTNNDAIRVVNELLYSGKNVEMIIEDGNGYKKGDFVVSRENLNSIVDNYYLDMESYNNEVRTSSLKAPKVAAVGWDDPRYVLSKELGFELVSPDKADVIVDKGGAADPGHLKPGKSYIGLGGRSLQFIDDNEIADIKWGKTSFSHEGILSAELSQDSIITNIYEADSYIYSSSGSYINQVPEGATVFARVVDSPDYYRAGWWPNNYKALDKIMGFNFKNNGLDLTLFAFNPTNRGQNSYFFRMVANSIYKSYLPNRIAY